jgi:nucleotide-binding universal stress UspA family protein
MKVLISISTDESAEVVLQEAKSFLNDLTDVEIHIFTVVDMAIVSIGRDDLDDMRMMESLEHQTDKFNANLARIMGDTRYTFSSEVGYPSDEILKKISSSSYDLLILGSHAHSALDQLLNTSVVEKILRHAACKTLVIPINKERAH